MCRAVRSVLVASMLCGATACGAELVAHGQMEGPFRNGLQEGWIKNYSASCRFACFHHWQTFRPSDR
jgi:hypothetical protein